MKEYDNIEIPLVAELEKAPDNLIYKFEGDYWRKDLLIDYLEENKQHWYRTQCHKYKYGYSEIEYWPTNAQGEEIGNKEEIELLTRDDFKSIDEIRALEFSEDFIEILA